MSRKNPVITQIKVQHKSFRIFEQFSDWLYDKSAWIIGEIDTSHLDTIMFSVVNTRELRMLVPDCGDDQLVIRFNVWGAPNYSVTYYEQLNDPGTGEEYFEATQTETFPIDQLHIAIECFMTRWASDKPFHASNLRPNTTSVSVDRINTTMTPLIMQHRLMDLNMVRISPYANINKETLLSSKHFGVNPTKFDQGSVPKSSIIREMANSIGVAVVEPSIRTGYTGDKNNHGDGSLDHIDW